MCFYNESCCHEHAEVNISSLFSFTEFHSTTVSDVRHCGVGGDAASGPLDPSYITQHYDRELYEDDDYRVKQQA